MTSLTDVLRQGVELYAEHEAEKLMDQAAARIEELERALEGLYKECISAGFWESPAIGKARAALADLNKATK